VKRRILGIALCILLFVPALSATGIERSTAPLGGDAALLQATAGVTIALTPYNPPITLPASGGTFQYAIEVANDRARPLAFEVWTTYTYPDGGVSGPVFGPTRFQLPDGWSAARDGLSEYVAGEMPSGAYTYAAHVGRYPDRILASSTFTFEKLPGGGWYPQSPGAAYGLRAIDFVDADTGWAVGSAWEILRTADGGDTWIPQDYGQPYPHSYLDLSFVDAQTGWVVGGIILHTADAGDNWTEQDSDYDYPLYGVFFVDANHGWAVGGYVDEFGGNERRVIEHTADGGDTWHGQLLEFSHDPLSSVHFADASHGWAVGPLGAILHTADGGGHWIEQTSGTTKSLNKVHFVDASTGWCVGEDGALLHTTDGGSNWLTQDAGTTADLEGVYFIDADTGWIAGVDWPVYRPVILHTTDGGDTWHTQDSGTGNSEISLYDIHFADADQGWAAGTLWPTTGVMLHTETGGE
jgi:photosystem II stability/assembly factor-like uncharacterized protein